MGIAIRQMFDGIAARYDFLNHFLSGGRDKAWRKKAVLSLRGKGPLRILDLCGGTGDFWGSWRDLESGQGTGRPGTGIIADFSLPMLKEAKRKFGSRESPRSGPAPAMVQMDALRPCFKEGIFDAVLCGFGMRNLDSLGVGVDEVRRLLKPGGAFITLEFFRPTTPFTRFFYGGIAPVCIPIMGGFFSSRREAYAYLVDSIRRFSSVQEYRDRFPAQGFGEVSIRSCDFGISHIVTAVRN